jgi:hypothetical protein
MFCTCTTFQPVGSFSTCNPSFFFYLFVRCFLIFFGDRFGRVSRGTLPILATIHAVLIKLHREYVLHRFLKDLCRHTAQIEDRALHNCCSPRSTNQRPHLLGTVPNDNILNFYTTTIILTVATAPIPCRRRCN